MDYARDDVTKLVSSIPSCEIEALQLSATLIGKIIERRQVLGWTQKQLAEITGLKQANISRFESAQIIPRTDTLLTIALALGLKVDLNINEKVSVGV